MNFKTQKVLLAILIILSYPSVSATLYAQTKEINQNSRTEWWNEARFGLFIHWGLYSAAAGQWDGKDVDGIGEWIQNFAKIPNSEYSKLVNEFTLQNYHPEEWAALAKQTGTKYIVFTAKHHEGFSLYPSDVTNFDIELTPYKGDPLKELISACRKEGIKVGLYYSHRQDWHEEDAAVMINEYDGHYGKPKSEIKPNLDRYIQQKALPQVRELLTRYGTIDLLWYDTPLDLTLEQSQAFVNIVRELQPNCIINGRVGFNLGDYGPLGDNEMPCAQATTELEMVATLNHTWGYKKNDNHWKKEKDILCSLIECASRNINYMVNIGPMADGTLPTPSIHILKFVGNWMEANFESIYGTTGNPFNDNFPWGYITRKGNNLFLHLTQSPQNNRIILKELHSDILEASVLSSGKHVSIQNGKEKTVIIPSGLNYDNIPVIKLSCHSPLIAGTRNVMNEQIISIPAASGKIKPGKKGKLLFTEGGVTENFNPETGSLLLACEIDEPGEYEINLYSSRHWRRSFTEGTLVTLKINDLTFSKCELKKNGELCNVRQNSYPETWSTLGTVQLNHKGTQKIELSIDKIGTFNRLGFFGEDLQGESDNNLRVMRIELKKIK